MTAGTITERIHIRGPLKAGFDSILTPKALEFVTELVQLFAPRVEQLLADRAIWQLRRDQGQRPCFLDWTTQIREDDWQVNPLPDDLLDRRVEITGPVDRKMIINGLNSGANVFMADFEDSNAPTWHNVISGQINLRDAVAGTIEFQHPTTGKLYRLNEDSATLMVRPRGWHLTEQHLVLDGHSVPAALVDFGLFTFHNAQVLVDRGTAPYFYLPKLESHLEARLWNDVFLHTQRVLGLPAGTFKATVLIETLPAAFQMHEILWELREHSAGLNCGRWDYIFSFIKCFREHPESLLPDRGQVGMTQPFMRAYTQLAIQTCHRRGVHAIGGMAAQIPIKIDTRANEIALAKVRQDKLREVTDGHDGTWVAHPGLVGLAREVFDLQMPGPHQLHRLREDLVVTPSELLSLPHGTRTEAGLRLNINVGIRYLESWLRGRGCVPLNHLMEDAATAEISRTQLWQWLRYGAELVDGRQVDACLFERLVKEEVDSIRLEVGQGPFEAGRYQQAISLFTGLVTAPTCEEFLTLPAYGQLATLVNTEL